MYRRLLILCVIFYLQLPDSCSAQCPTGCTCKEQVANCTELTSLPELTEFPGDTQEFIFISCDFGTLPKITYTAATTLIFSHSNINDISAGAFSDLALLHNLDLSANPLREIRPDMFEGLHSLTELNLINTQLSGFPAGVVSLMPSLDILDLSSNTNIQFSDDAFPTTSLTRLSLDNCSLTEPPTLTQSNLNSVTRLDLNRNEITTLPDYSFVQFEGLQKLYLDANHIHSIHKLAFQSLADLEELYLGLNNITMLHADTFKKTTKLKILDLRKNQLETLKHEVFEGLEDLQSIDLGDNAWKCDCENAWIADMPVKEPSTVLCAKPEGVMGMELINVTSSLDCPCYSDCDEKSNYIALAVGIPIIIICVGLIGFFIYKIIQSRRDRQSEKNVRYSAVYRDTTEATEKHRPTSDL